MIEKIKITVITLATIFSITLSYYLIDRFSYAKEMQLYPIGIDNDTILRVGIIGDSWVAGKKLDAFLLDEFKVKGVNSMITSSGHVGAKSKLIYQNIFKDSTDSYSSKFVITSHPDYCIVIAGVNDALVQVGAKFYSHHLSLIINILLRNNIIPVIVELPKFGIIKATNDMNWINKTRFKIFSSFNNKGEIDNIETYRSNLNNLLIGQGLNDKIIFIDFDKVCSSYEECKEIYKNDGIHLNERGNKLLSQAIAHELLKRITTR